MQLGAANRVTCSTNEVLYPVKRDHMLVKGARVCIIPRHERDLFRSISHRSDGQGPSNRPEPLHNDFWNTLYYEPA